MLELFIDGINIKDIKMTQDGKGQFILKNGTKNVYANVTMAEFPNALIKVPVGYTAFSSGSHKAYLYQLAIDISATGWLTSNEDYKVTFKFVDGEDSYFKGDFKSLKGVFLVHTGNTALSVGDTVKAGSKVVKSVSNHYHIFASGKDFYKFYMDQYKMELPTGIKTGYELTATSVRNIRVDFGLDQDVIGKMLKGDTATVLSERFPIDDGYSWINVKFGNIVGWVAYKSSWFTVKVSTCEQKLAEAEKELKTLNERIIILNSENTKLRKAINDAKPKFESGLKDLNVV